MLLRREDSYPGAGDLARTRQPEGRRDIEGEVHHGVCARKIINQQMKNGMNYLPAAKGVEKPPPTSHVDCSARSDVGQMPVDQLVLRTGQ